MNFTSNKVISLLLVVIIVSSCLLIYRQIDLQTADAVLASEYTSLGLSVTPDGSYFKLGVDESKTFTAQATNGTAPFIYTWTLNPTGNFILSVNGENHDVTEASSVEVTGETLTLSYPTATEEYVSISVKVADVNGFVGQKEVPFIVADPYTSSGYKFDGSAATADYIVQTDGKGWYRAINGVTGAVQWSSTNASYIITTAIITGNSTFIKTGNYPITVNIDVENLKNRIITGDGPSVRLYLPNSQASGWDTHRILYLSGCSNFTISNLCFDGNFLNNAAYVDYGALIDVWDSHDIAVRSCHVVNGRIFGIQFGSDAADCYSNSVTDCTVKECKWNGIQTNGWSASYTCYGNIFSHNIVSGAGDYGIALFADVAAKRPYGNIISENIVDCYPATDSTRSYGSSDAYWGIRVEAGYGNKVVDNVIYNANTGIADSTAQGVCQDNVFQGNIIWMNGPTTAFAGIASYGKLNLIKDNIIYGGYSDWGNGIVVWGNSTSIIGNDIWEVGGHANMNGVHEHTDGDPFNTCVMLNRMNCTNAGIYNGGSGTGDYWHDNYYGGIWNA